MQIRPEVDADCAAVWAVNESAFGTTTEARLVNALREQAHPIISLVAEEKGEIVGHIMFSPVVLEGHSGLKIIGLGPMAVMPQHQREGIGSQLVRAGLEECKKLGFGAVVVIGHAQYYPRFGFTPAGHFGIGCEYDVPADVFMVTELTRDYLAGISGKIKYHESFNNV